MIEELAAQLKKVTDELSFYSDQPEFHAIVDEAYRTLERYELHKRQEQAWKNRLRPFLYCSCGAEYSACPGDYWFITKEKPFICECGEEMELAVRHSLVEIIAEAPVTISTLEQAEKVRKQ